MALLRRLSEGVRAFLTPKKLGIDDGTSHPAIVQSSPYPMQARKRRASSISELDTMDQSLTHAKRRRGLGITHESDSMDLSESEVDSHEGDEAYLSDPGSLYETRDQDDSELQTDLTDIDQQLPGVSTEELKGNGWDEAHIHLVKRFARRGYEPVFPAYYKWDFRNLPDSLFSATDDAFISSTCHQHYRAIKALDRLLGIGSRMRDRARFVGRGQTEIEFQRSLSAYQKWAYRDAALCTSSPTSNLAIVAKPDRASATTLQQIALQKMQRLWSRCKASLQAQPSIESSPFSDSTALAHPIPQIYAAIASDTVVALVAYRPNTSQEIRPVIFFDFHDQDYDVWNALALAIIVHHCRDIQLQISRETGIGKMDVIQHDRVVVPDPDL